MRSAGRIFMGLAALAVAAGVAYALVSKELAGSVMLGVFAVALLYIANTLNHAGPFDRAEVDQDAEPELGPEHMLAPSWWPLVMAVGAGATLLGLKFAPVLMGIGALVFLASAVGWFVAVGHQHEAHGVQHGPEEHAGVAHEEPGAAGTG